MVIEPLNYSGGQWCHQNTSNLQTIIRKVHTEKLQALKKLAEIFKSIATSWNDTKNQTKIQKSTPQKSYESITQTSKDTAI